jgi:glycosyltransferase involved in cell wall biosynthesis
LFTVIITTFNRDKFLKKAYDSVIKQTLKPKEIIIVNNGIYKYKVNNFKYNKNSQFKLRIINNKKNLFCSKARNIGAKISKGKYVCFLDDDDEWAKNYLENAKKIISIEKPDIVLSRIIKNQKIFKDPINIHKNDILVRNPGVTGSNIIINKKKFFSLGGFKNSLEPSEDKDLILTAILNQFKISYSRTNVFFRSHKNERIITNYKKLSLGANSFYKKYKYLMNFKQKLIVINKIEILKFKSKNFLRAPILIFFYLLNKMINDI